MPGPDARGLRVFISYRRDESIDAARALYLALSAQLPRSQVFWDISAIEPGLDFAEVIDHAVGSCDVLIALLGRQWLTARDQLGQRRLDDPQDFVRLEIATALARRIRVVPVLLHGAVMPREDQLPTAVQALARRNALELSASRWDYDVGRLVEWLERVQQQLAQDAGPVQPQPPAVSEPVSTPTPTPALCLVRLAGPGDSPQQQWLLPEQGTLVLGRAGSTYGSPDVDLSPDHLVSRRHARLQVQGGTTVLIEDLGSTYGTRVGEREIRGAGLVPWAPHQQVFLGLSTLGLAPAPATPTTPITPAIAERPGAGGGSASAWAGAVPTAHGVSA